MKQWLIAFMATGLLVFQAYQVHCEEKEKGEIEEQYDYEAPAYRGGKRHMMGYGPYGYWMDRCGPGMDRDSKWGRRPVDWESMTREEQKKWEEMRAKHQMETLELRKELASKRVELETLWNQPEIDQGRIEKLSGEIAEVEAQLAKKRDKHLLECRKQLGDRGWACPGSW